jgi:hypothetical protein
MIFRLLNDKFHESPLTLGKKNGGTKIGTTIAKVIS